MSAVRATPVELQGSMATAEAFRQIFAACLQHAVANCELIHCDNPEAVHQTRVGFRRARSALAVFKPLIKKSQRKPTDCELQTMGRHLAPCRDWDVFLSETLPRIAKKSDMRTIHEAAKLRQTRAYQQLDIDVDAPALTESVELEDNQTIKKAAPDLLDLQFFKVRHCCRHIDTAEERHTLRKSMKKLRYGVEFLGSVFEHKPVHAFLDHCKDMQEVLGKMNDANATIHLLMDLEADLEQTVLARPMEWARGQEDKTADHLAGMIVKFHSAKPFWD